MLNIYLTGRYDNYKMKYAGIVETVGDAALSRNRKVEVQQGFHTCICGELLGSKPETEIQAVQVALKRAFSSGEATNLYTDFSNMEKRVNGKIKATSQNAKELSTFADVVRARIDLQIIEELSDRVRLVLDYILDNHNTFGEWRYCSVEWKKPSFRVIIRDRKGNILCDFDENHFGGVLADAIQFANWYERESTNEKSDYYGVTVERYNVPSTR